MFGLVRKKEKQNTIEEGVAEKSNVITTIAHEPKTYLEQYLAYYVSRLEPGYAVLVTGDWGAGKTFQVRDALPDDRAYYVSLFGLNTPEDIEGQVFSKMFPGRSAAKKFADKADSVSVEVPLLGSLGSSGLASILANIFIKNEIDNSRPLILDDLERCSVEIGVLLGLINRYVEHHKCRVIVIAHDAKIVQEFAESKEKVFGQTLNVEPNIDSAFANFNAVFADEDGKDRLGDLKNEVLSIFRESKSASLRVLRHVIEDVRRLASAFEDQHINNRMAMVEVIRLFSALSIEIRNNRLDKTALNNRRKTVLAFQLRSSIKNNDEQIKPLILTAASNYKSIDILSELLNDDVLIEMLIEGRFVPEHIRSSLNASAYFLEREAAPPWQVVGSFDKLDDNDVEGAVQRMNDQFAKREIIDSGEFLHVVALKMMIASKGLTKETVRQVCRAAKIYIDDLLKERRLPPRLAGSRWIESFDGAHAGVSYWVADDYSAKFKEVFDYLIEARTKALESTYPELIGPLLEVVRTDGQKFFEKVCFTNSGKIEYEDIPVLAHIPAADFVDAWLASPKAGWYWIGNALKERHKATAHYSALKPETTWYPAVVREMEKRARAKSGLAKLRITRAAGMVGLPRPAARKPRPKRPAAKSSEEAN